MSSDELKRVISQARIASPCTAKWDEMEGDERTRLCAKCNLNVHNTAMMSEVEVLDLMLAASGGERVCARLFKRADGTLITQDCPVGVSRLRRRARAVATFVAGALSVLLSTVVSAAPVKSGKTSGKKPLFHATVQADSPTGTKSILPLSAVAPALAKPQVVDEGYQGGMWAAPVSPGIIAYGQKRLAEAEKKFGTDSLEAAEEHVRLFKMLRSASANVPESQSGAALHYGASPQHVPTSHNAVTEEHSEAAYQIYKKHGLKSEAKALAKLVCTTDDPVVLSKWKPRCDGKEAFVATYD